MVRRGLASSRTRAQALVDAGRVVVGGAPARKAARMVDPAESVAVSGPPARFVGRGGDKLEAALDRFAIDVEGRRGLDAGASTGGFTDCLLQRGASAVIAIDVGRGQLDHGLREDPRVDSRERTDIRSVDVATIGGAAQVTVADVSFISLARVIPALVALTAPGGDLVLLAKPQFEAGRTEASKAKGVIRDPAVWRRALQSVLGALSDAGAAIMGVMPSPVRGAAGNVEFLVHAVIPSADRTASGRTDLATLVDDAVQAVGEA